MMMIIYGCLLIHIHILWSDKAILKMVCFNKLTHCEVWLESPRLAPFMLCTTCTARKTHHDKQPAYIILQLIWLTIVLYICNEFFVTQGEAAGAASLWFIWRSGIFFLGKLEWIFWTITLAETTPPKHSISSWLLKKITLTLFFGRGLKWVGRIHNRYLEREKKKRAEMVVIFQDSLRC